MFRPVFEKKMENSKEIDAKTKDLTYTVERRTAEQEKRVAGVPFGISFHSFYNSGGFLKSHSASC